jgi:hypothetical protein
MLRAMKAPSVAAESSGTTSRRRRPSDHQRLAVLALPTPFEAGLLTADPGLIDLHRSRQAAPVGIDHRPAQLVEKQPGGLVARDPELGLELEGRDAGLQRRHKVGRDEPCRERESGPVEHGPGRRRSVMAAGAADPDAAGGQQPPIAAVALRAAKPGGPARLDQIAEAGTVVVEAAVELPEGARVVARLSAAHASTLHLVSC